jgi:hypothetical protein
MCNPRRTAAVADLTSPYYGRYHPSAALRRIAKGTHFTAKTGLGMVVE